MNRLLLCSFLLCFLFNELTLSQVSKSKIENLLTENGFENILVNHVGNKYVIFYENRVYRFEPRAIITILDTVVPLITDAEELELVPMNRKIPIVVIKLNINDYIKFTSKEIDAENFVDRLDININVDNYMEMLDNVALINTSTFRFDLIVKPTATFQFGPYDHPIRGQINLAPEIRTSFWKGMDFKYETIIPLWNEFFAKEDSVRTGSVVLNQTYRFTNDWYLSTSTGIFTNDRYGFDFELRKYFLNGDLSIGTNYGLTSYISFSGLNRIKYYDKFIWTGSINSEYRIQKYDLTLGLTFGKYLLGDNTIRVDINREFGEIEIGFFALKSFEGVSNGGVAVKVPLFPSKYWNPSVVRPRIAETYSLTYLVKNNLDDQIGKRYDTGNRIQSFFKKINPGFIKNSLIKIYQHNNEVKDD